MKTTKAKICAVLLLCAGIFTVTLTVASCSSKKQKDKSAGDTAQQSAAPSEEPTVEKTRGSVSRSTKPAPKGKAKEG
jgi:ABC-type enterochelin transport system substrate-binding protein